MNFFVFTLYFRNETDWNISILGYFQLYQKMILNFENHMSLSLIVAVQCSSAVSIKMGLLLLTPAFYFELVIWRNTCYSWGFFELKCKSIRIIIITVRNVTYLKIWGVLTLYVGRNLVDNLIVRFVENNMQWLNQLRMQNQSH